MTESGEDRKPRRFRIVTPHGVLRIAILVALCPVAGLFGSYYWFLDLFNHLQAQYFCFLLLAALTLAVWKKPRLALVAAALVMIPGIQLAPLYLPSGTSAESPRLRVASFNILGSNTRYADAVAWIKSADPDFIHLPETHEEWGKGIEPLRGTYPHAVDVFINGNFGFSFRSKHPVIRHEVHRLGNMGLPLLHAVVATPHGEVTVFGAHPVPPVTEFWADERDLYLREFAGLAAKTTGRLVILGDLNATRWSHSMAPFFSQGILDSADGHGFSATWMRENPLAAIPIDHILTRGFSGVPGRWTGPALGSDHRPVVADLSW
jgi:endonuclease/exonuclease/phosphatase (EEP) superfamily protein YafD